MVGFLNIFFRGERLALAEGLLRMMGSKQKAPLAQGLGFRV